MNGKLIQVTFKSYVDESNQSNSIYNDGFQNGGSSWRYDHNDSDRDVGWEVIRDLIGRRSVEEQTTFANGKESILSVLVAAVTRDRESVM